MRLYQNKYPISENAKYVVDYICNAPAGEPNFYYALVRLSDDAILYANANVDYVKIECWSLGINRDEVSFI